MPWGAGQANSVFLGWPSWPLYSKPQASSPHQEWMHFLAALERDGLDCWRLPVSTQFRSGFWPWHLLMAVASKFWGLCSEVNFALHVMTVMDFGERCLKLALCCWSIQMQMLVVGPWNG